MKQKLLHGLANIIPLYLPICSRLKVPAKKRTDKGEFWWELRACAYYEAFDNPKIIYPVISQGAKFSVESTKAFSNDKTFIIPKGDNYLPNQRKRSRHEQSRVCTVWVERGRGGDG